MSRLNLLVPRRQLITHSGAMTFVRAQSLLLSATSSYAITLSVTPVEGNLMIFMLGGAASGRTGTISGSGWTKIDLSALSFSVHCFYKTAGPSEPTAITVTLTGGTLAGTIEYYEFSGHDVGSPPSGIQVDQAWSSSTTVTMPSTPITTPGVLVCVYGKALTDIWNVNNGWTKLTGAGNRSNSAYKLVNPSNIAYNETFTWTSAGAADTGQLVMIGFKSAIGA